MGSFVKKTSFLKLTIVLSACLLSLGAKSNNHCSQLFNEPKQFPQEFINQLKTQNFKINSLNQLIDTLNNKLIGEIEVRHAEQLYEWADLNDYQEVWMKNGGLSQKDVDANIAHDNQSLGRGFYVSTNPIDSREYGPALSIFQTNGAIYTTKNTNSTITSDIQYIKRLQKAGLDGFSNGETWLCLITARHLKAARKITDPIWARYKSTTVDILQDLELAVSIKYSNLVPLFDINTLVGKILRSELTQMDIQVITNVIEKHPELLIKIASLNDLSPQIKSIVDKVGHNYYENLISKLNTANITDISSIFRDSLWTDKSQLMLNVNLSGLHTKYLNKNILNIFKYFDIHKVYGILINKKSDYGSYTNFINQSKTIIDSIDQDSLKKITSLTSFIQLVSSFLNNEISVRNDIRFFNFRNDYEKVRISLYNDSKQNVANQKLLIMEERIYDKSNVIIEYTNLKTFPKFSQFISSKLNRKISNALKNKTVDELINTAYGKMLQKQYLTELTQLFFTSDLNILHSFVQHSLGTNSTIDNILILKAFKAIHPFNEQNDLLEQVYFLYLQQKFPETQYSHIIVNTSLSGIGLLMSNSEYLQQIINNHLLVMYLATATNQKNFEHKLANIYLSLVKNHHYLTIMNSQKLY